MLAVVLALAPIRGDSKADQGLPALSHMTLRPDVGTGYGTAENKLKDIFISHQFKNATLAQATIYLNAESRRLDPEHRGVYLFPAGDVLARAKPITIMLKSTPLDEAIDQVADAAGIEVFLQGNEAVWVSTLRTIGSGTVKNMMMLDRCQRIIINKVVTYNKVDVAEVVKDLTLLSHKFDSHGSGVNVTLDGSESKTWSGRKVTMQLENIPLSDLLDYIAVQTKLTYTVDLNGVVFHSSNRQSAP